jgi:type II secretory pathway component PulF
MATTQPDLAKTDPPVRGSVFTWTATILACAYIIWSGTRLYLAIPSFIDLYKSLNVELPLATRIVFAVYRFAYPVLLLGATAVLIAKQFYVRQKWINLGITLGATLVVEIMSRGTIWAIYHPMFDIAEKLNK